jgi:hypothetical protein
MRIWSSLGPPIDIDIAERLLQWDIFNVCRTNHVQFMWGKEILKHCSCDIPPLNKND